MGQTIHSPPLGSSEADVFMFPSPLPSHQNAQGRTELDFTNGDPGTPGDTRMCLEHSGRETHQEACLVFCRLTQAASSRPRGESIVVCKVSYSHIKRTQPWEPGALGTGRPSFAAWACQGPG